MLDYVLFVIFSAYIRLKLGEIFKQKSDKNTFIFIFLIVKNNSESKEFFTTVLKVVISR